MELHPNAPWRCEACGFAQPRPIARLRVSTLALYDDGRFPGRCVLVLDEHAIHIEELSLERSLELALDVRQAGLAVRGAAQAGRVNYAAFGNVVPHVHVHLIPRHGAWETAPTATAWDHPEPERPLPPGEAERLAVAIRTALSGR